MPEIPNRILILSILWFAGLYLRLPVLIAPPLTLLIDAELALNQTQLGALTTIPVLMLSLGALPGAVIIARLGPALALVAALVLLTLASIGRGLAPPVWILFLNTTFVGLAIAVMQPAFPALVQRWCPGFVAMGSAVYMNGMLMGEFIGGGLTISLVIPFVDNEWRAALAFWSLPAILIAGVVLMRRRLGVIEKSVGEEGPPIWKPPLGELRVWQLGIILGAAAAGYFGTNAYMPTLLEFKQIPEDLPHYLLVFNGTQVVGSLIMVALAARLVGSVRPIIVVSWGTLLGLVGILLLDGFLGLMGAIVLGLSTCIQLILVVALVPLISSSRESAPLAAGMFMIAYLLGFIVPLLGGLIADAFASPAMTFTPLMLLAIVAIAISHTSDNLGAAEAHSN